MKKVLMIAAIIGLSGCSNGYSEKNFPVVPDELKDCRFFALTNDSGAHITVARCPNSATTTTYKSGKTTKATVVIDGATYVKEDK